MNLKEAKELLKKNGYKLSINEDKYMDALDDEIDTIYYTGNLKQVYEPMFKKLEQHFGGKIVEEEKNLLKLPIDKRLYIAIETNHPKELLIYVRRIAKDGGYYITHPMWNFHPNEVKDDDKINEMIGDFEKVIKKEQNPGFFKKLFNPEYNESTEVNEDYNFYRNRFHQMNLKRKKAAEEKKSTGLASDEYQDDLNEVVSVISKKHEVIGTKEVPAEEGYKDYKIVTKDNLVYTLEFKNRMFDYRGHLYPWRLTLSTSKFGFVVIGYSLNQLKNYFNKVK